MGCGDEACFGWSSRLLGCAWLRGALWGLSGRLVDNFDVPNRRPQSSPAVHISFPSWRAGCTQVLLVEARLAHLHRSGCGRTCGLLVVNRPMFVGEPGTAVHSLWAGERSFQVIPVEDGTVDRFGGGGVFCWGDEVKDTPRVEKSRRPALSTKAAVQSVARVVSCRGPDRRTRWTDGRRWRPGEVSAGPVRTSEGVVRKSWPDPACGRSPHRCLREGFCGGGSLVPEGFNRNPHRATRGRLTPGRVPRSEPERPTRREGESCLDAGSPRCG